MFCCCNVVRNCSCWGGVKEEKSTSCRKAFESSSGALNSSPVRVIERCCCGEGKYGKGRVVGEKLIFWLDSEPEKLEV